MDRAVERYLNGDSINQLAHDYGIPYSTMRSRLIKYGPPARSRGQHHACKDIDRLMQRAAPEPNTGCWIWLGPLDKHGYGRAMVNKQKTTAHRAMWIASFGPITSKMEADHICKIRCCVNPDHLQLISKHENLSQRNLHKTHCKKGHPFTPETTMFECGGKIRRCRICRNASRARRGA